MSFGSSEIASLFVAVMLLASVFMFQFEFVGCLLIYFDLFTEAESLRSRICVRKPSLVRGSQVIKELICHWSSPRVLEASSKYLTLYSDVFFNA